MFVKIKTTRDRANKKINEQRKLTEFEEGDLVLIRMFYPSDSAQGVISKFFELYQGPYKVKRRIGDATYLLSDPKDEKKERGKFNVRTLKKYCMREISDIDSPSHVN